MIAHLLGAKVHGAQLCGPGGGKVTYAGRRSAETEIKISLAGRLAGGRDRWPRDYHHPSDDRNALDALRFITLDPRQERRLLRILTAQTRNMLRRHWRAVHRIAAGLIQRRCLSGPELRKIISQR